MLTETISSISNPSQSKQLGCFVFISSCFDVWGGSEELFGSTAKYLKQQGHEVYVFKLQICAHPRILELQAAGVKVIALNSLQFLKVKHHAFILIHYLVRLLRFLPIPVKCYFIHKQSLLLQTLRRIESSLLVISQKDNIDPQRSFLLHTLRQIEPSLVVISQGDNFDGLNYGHICLELNLPYVIISQKASDPFWPHGNKRQMMQDVYRKAKFSFFVSQHNLSLTEAQIAYRFTNAEVIRNPHQALIPEALLYPRIENDCFKIACVARLWILDKGQDVLLRVLAQDKWQNRNLQISFFGEGVDREALMDMATLLGIKNVSFYGFVNNILDVWHHHHALIMPSRAEGLPIALVEAMMCGRPAIVTDVGGISEVVEDNLTGFIAKGAFFTAVDEAMERAWQRRYEWEYIGKQASIYIRKIIPPYPEQIFADKLIKLSNWKTIATE